MKDDKTFDGALCAGVGTADAAGAAPAAGKKKYVSPTMQVIPLGPQRMLATSGVSGDPVAVLVRGGFDFYNGDSAYMCKYSKEDLRADALLKSPLLANNLDGVYRWLQTAPPPSRYIIRSCIGDTYRTVSFGSGGEGWSEADFLANVKLIFDEEADPDDAYLGNFKYGGTFTNSFPGSYNGRPVLVTIQLDTTSWAN
ncbi:MAG: hypothetical protein IJ729_04100 [Alloprevotella sp.]|nr:hypothetical protein [Alloprevotella sp.]